MKHNNQANIFESNRILYSDILSVVYECDLFQIAFLTSNTEKTALIF